MANANSVSRRAAWPLLLLVIALWGCNWPVMKTSLAFIGPLQFAAARMLLAALLWAILIVLVRGYRGVSSTLTLAPWQFLVAATLLLPLALIFESPAAIHPNWTLAWALLYNGPAATGFAFWGMLTATRALPAITTSLATLAVPVVGNLAAALTLGERITATNATGLALILTGLALVSLADPGGGKRQTNRHDA